MRWISLLVMLLSPAASLAQSLTDAQFVDVVQLKNPADVAKMDQQVYRVQGYAFLRNGQLYIRPLKRPAEVELDYACEWCRAFCLKSIRASASGRTKVDVQVVAHTQIQEESYPEGFQPPYWLEDGRELRFMTKAQQALETREYARRNGQLKIQNAIRLWRLDEAKPYYTPAQKRLLGL